MWRFARCPWANAQRASATRACFIPGLGRHARTRRARGLRGASLSGRGPLGWMPASSERIPSSKTSSQHQRSTFAATGARLAYRPGARTASSLASAKRLATTSPSAIMARSNCTLPYLAARRNGRGPAVLGGCSGDEAMSGGRHVPRFPRIRRRRSPAPSGTRAPRPSKGGPGSRSGGGNVRSDG